MLNNTGPRTEPCGTPNSMIISSENEFPTFTLLVRPIKKDLNQARAEPPDAYFSKQNIQQFIDIDRIKSGTKVK